MPVIAPRLPLLFAPVEYALRIAVTVAAVAPVASA